MGRSGGGGGGGGFGGGFSGGFGGGSSFGGMGGGFSGGSSGGGRSGAPFGGPSYGPVGHSGGGGSFLGGFLLGNLLSGSGRGGGGGQVPQGPPPNPNGGGNNPQGQGPQGNGGSSAGGCLIVIAVLIAATLLIGLLGALLDAPGCAGSSDITASTTERTALPAGSAEETPYFTDEDGGWIGDPRTLENGMSQFYIETGVRPYLYILPNGSETSTSELQKQAQSLYDEMFNDGAHFLLVFCDNGKGAFNAAYWVGQEALTVMDSQALQIFQDYLKRYYNDYSISESEMFAETYEQTAHAIMTTEAERSVPAIIAIAVALAVVIAVIVIATVIRRNRQAKERDRIRQQEILNTPLEKFDDANVEKLAREYEAKRNDKAGDGIPDTPSVDYPAPSELERFSDSELEALEKKYGQQENGGGTPETERPAAEGATKPSPGDDSGDR